MPKALIQRLAKTSGFLLVGGLALLMLVYPRSFFCGFLPLALILVFVFITGKKVYAAQVIARDHASPAVQRDLIPSAQHDGLTASASMPIEVRQESTSPESSSVPPSTVITTQTRSLQENPRFAELLIRAHSATIPSQLNGEVIINDPDSSSLGQDTDAQKPAFSFSYETRDTTFRREAQQQRHRDGRPVPHVPFMTYWPTYTSLAPDQRRWYFYWRTCFRKGTILETDLSYLFLHVYELLNLVEEPNPQRAADRLWHLWQCYRGQHPKLDNYVPRWGGDLLAIHHHRASALEWWTNTLDLDVRLPEPIVNCLIQHHVDTNTVATMPAPLWRTLHTYRPTNKFYQRYHTEYPIDAAFHQALLAINAYWMTTHGCSLPEHIASATATPMQHTAFVSAVVTEDQPQTIDLGVCRSYRISAQSDAFFTSILKYTENLLRQRLGFTRKLPGVILDPALADILDRTFESSHQSAQHARISIDPETVQRLHTESEQIYAILTDPSVPKATADDHPISGVAPDSQPSPDPNGTGFWARLTPIEQQLIDAIREDRVTTVTQLEVFARSRSTFPAVLLDTINTHAIAYGGTPILRVEGDRLVLTDAAFLEDASVKQTHAGSPLFEPASILLPHPAHDVLNVMGEPLPESDEAVQWTLLVQTLTESEVMLCRHLFAHGHLLDEELDRLLRPYHAMGQATLEAFNEKTMTILGYALLYHDGDSWLIEESDSAILSPMIKDRYP